MAFEQRESAGPDLDIARRDPGTAKPRKRPGGRRGEAARLAAAELANERDRRDAERRERAEADGRLREIEALTSELAAAAQTLMEVALLIDGWHCPNYGPWRRKRNAEPRA